MAAERERRRNGVAHELRQGDLIYVTNDSAHEDTVYRVRTAGRSGDVVFLSCALRGPDSNIYANSPAYVFVQLPAHATVEVVG
jgi:hypothetical protein